VYVVGAPLGASEDARERADDGRPNSFASKTRDGLEIGRPQGSPLPRDGKPSYATRTHCFATRQSPVAMPMAFVHELLSQGVVLAPGALARVTEEAERLGMARALVVATPGSGARLGARVVDLLGPRALGLAAQAVMHVPRPVAEAGLAAARDADGLLAVG